MKFSQVFVVLSVLFAISFAVPANWKENEELVASNDNEEKRFVVTTWLAKQALGRALKLACDSGKLSGRIKGACDCASMLLGRDEEFKAEKRWFFSSNVVDKLKSAVKKYCKVKGLIGKVLKTACDCITPFI